MPNLIQISLYVIPTAPNSHVSLYHFEFDARGGTKIEHLFKIWDLSDQRVKMYAQFSCLAVDPIEINFIN